MLEEYEISMKALQDALVAAENSGEPRPFDDGAFIKRMHGAQGG